MELSNDRERSFIDAARPLGGLASQPKIWHEICRRLRQQLARQEMHNAVLIFPTARSEKNVTFLLDGGARFPAFRLHYQQLKNELQLQCRCTLFRQLLDRVLNGGWSPSRFACLSPELRGELKDAAKRGSSLMADELAFDTALYENFHRAMDWYMVLGAYPMAWCSEEGPCASSGNRPLRWVPRFEEAYIFQDTFVGKYLAAVYRVDRRRVSGANARLYFLNTPKREAIDGSRFTLTGPLTDLVPVHERLNKSASLADQVASDNAKCHLILSDCRPGEAETLVGPKNRERPAEKQFNIFRSNPKELNDFLKVARRNIGEGDRSLGEEEEERPSALTFATHFDAWFEQQLERRINGPAVDTAVLKKTVKQMSGVIEKQHKALDCAHERLEESLGREEGLTREKDTLRARLERVTEMYRQGTHDLATVVGGQPGKPMLADSATDTLPVTITRLPPNSKYLNAKLHGETPHGLSADVTYYENCCRGTLASAFYLMRKFTAQGTHVDLALSNRTVCSVIFPFLQSFLSADNLLDGSLCQAYGLEPENGRDPLQWIFDLAYNDSALGRSEAALVELENEQPQRGQRSILSAIRQ